MFPISFSRTTWFVCALVSVVLFAIEDVALARARKTAGDLGVVKQASAVRVYRIVYHVVLAALGPFGILAFFTSLVGTLLGRQLEREFAAQWRKSTLQALDFESDRANVYLTTIALLVGVPSPRMMSEAHVDQCVGETAELVHQLAKLGWSVHGLRKTPWAADVAKAGEA